MQMEPNPWDTGDIFCVQAEQMKEGGHEQVIGRRGRVD